MSELADETQNDTPAITLWPFWALDGILSLVAIVIAARSEGGLNAAEAFVVFGGLFFGGIILIAPYFIEFMALARAKTSEVDRMYKERLRALEESIRALGVLHDAMEDEGSSDQDKLLMTVGGKLDALKTQVESADKKVAKLAKAGGGSVQQSLENLDKFSAETQQSIQEIQMMLQRLLDETGGEPLKVELAENVPPSHSGGRLMERATDSESASVSGDSALKRIIGSDTTEKEVLEETADVSDEEAPSEAVVDAPVAQEEAEEDEIVEETEPQAEEEPAETETEEVATPDTGELFDDASVNGSSPEEKNPLRASKKKSGKGGADKTRIVVEALIGIGNKPYLRGNAGGLDPDKGIPMEYLEIGRWEWASGSVSEPFTCHVYLNDETPAKEETTVQPGEDITVSPTF